MEVGALAVSVVGTVLAAYSICYARRQAARARTAAQQARDAAEQAQRYLRQNAAIADLTQAIEQIELLKELHNTSQWERARDKYTPIRQRIQAVRERHPGLTEEDMRLLQGAVILIRSMEDRVVEALFSNREPEDAPRLFRMLNRVQTRLGELSNAFANEYQVGGKA